MRLSATIAALLLSTTTTSAITTSIWIDQIPAYTALAPCAEDRVSAVVRAQASGCGDNQQLTSFSCFCIEQSSQMSSIISTAVQDHCAATATVSLTTALPEVTAALKVFNSYCARSTELAWYQNNSTSTTQPPTISITTAPSTTPTPTSSSPPTSSSKHVPVAAIAAPVVLGVLALAGIVGLLFFLRRRKSAKADPYVEISVPPTELHAPPVYVPRGELDSAGTPAQELPAEIVKYRFETRGGAVELDGEGTEKGGRKG